MNEELREEAKKKVQAKMGFYICAVVFAFTSLLLLMLSFYLPAVAIWLWLPIPIFLMVLGILYLSIFGLPSKGALSSDWKEEEIEKEMIKLYRQKKDQLPRIEQSLEAETLELKEMERLEQKRSWEEDIV